MTEESTLPIIRVFKSEQDKVAYNTVRRLFKNDNGDPFEMTGGQIDLFRAIYEKQCPRTQFDCYTQYGKSDIVSMALILRATTFPEKWIILGASKDKAEIIGRKAIKHIFENNYCLAKFDIREDESLEAIKRERSRGRVTFKVDDTGAMGEIMILSADARRKDQDAGDILIGHGGKNLIEDDAALIPDHIHGKAMRMLGGHKDNFLLKITNSFGNNHAKRTTNPNYVPKYNFIKIPWEQGFKEGRLTMEYINEMRETLDPIMFDILYNCKYPPSGMVEDGGWIPMISKEEILAAQQRKVEAEGKKLMGVDVAKGTNYNVIVIKQDNYAKVVEKNQEKDPLATAERLVEIQIDELVANEDIFVDAFGPGAKVVGRAGEMNVHVNAVLVGDPATEKDEEELLKDPTLFFNLRSEICWKMCQWIKKGGALEPHAGWMQLTKLRWKAGESKKIQVMPKIMMRVKGLISPMESPDVADSLSLTFAPSTIINYNNKQSEPLPPFYPSIGV